MKMSDRLARLAALKPPRPNWYAQIAGPRGFAPEAPHGAQRLAELLNAVPRRNHFGEHLFLRKWLVNDSGEDEAAIAKSAAAAHPLLAPDAPGCAADPSQWLFLDTETTGLAGGTGTYPFLVGLAWWDAGGLEVEQLFLREPSEEHSLLTALSERLAARPVLVTFNGKSFDWPLLETRYRMTRAIDVPEPRAHIDFLHPARALWRPRLGSVRLSEIERHVLGWNRGADVISEMIPQIYFDYLRGGAPEPLVPVFRHNEMDLRGLARIATRILALLAEPEIHGQDALELFGASRLCERRGHAARARSLYQRSIDRQLPLATNRFARRSLARLAKREGDFALARELWDGLLGASAEGFEAFEQLAIHYERREKNPEKAAALSQQGLLELRRANRLGLLTTAASRRIKMRFEKRLSRLTLKLNSSLQAALAPATESNYTSRENERSMPRCVER